MQNNLPIFTSNPLFAGVMVSGSIGDPRGEGTGTIGTSHFLCCSGSASGSYIQKLRIMPVSSGSITLSATVIRIFISNRLSGATLPSNTFLHSEVATAALAAGNSANANSAYEVPMNIAIPSGSSILVSMHTASINNGWWAVTAYGGEYI